jgi:hypothetical protein
VTVSLGKGIVQSFNCVGIKTVRVLREGSAAALHSPVTVSAGVEASPLEDGITESSLTSGSDFRLNLDTAFPTDSRANDSLLHVAGLLSTRYEISSSAPIAPWQGEAEFIAGFDASQESGAQQFAPSGAATMHSATMAMMSRVACVDAKKFFMLICKQPTLERD